MKQGSRMLAIKKEPSLIVGTVSALLAVVVAYGGLTAERATAWAALTAALLPLLQAVVTRSLVFAPHTLERAGLDPKEVETTASEG